MQTSSSLPDDGQRKIAPPRHSIVIRVVFVTGTKVTMNCILCDNLSNKVTRRLTATDDARTNARIAATEKILDRLNVPLILPPLSNTLARTSVENLCSQHLRHTTWTELIGTELLTNWPQFEHKR